MRPRTASRRAGNRLMLTVVAIVVVGLLGVAVALLVSTTEQRVVTLAVETVGVVGVIAGMQRGNDHDQRRVNAYLIRLADPRDDPETDPRTD